MSEERCEACPSGLEYATEDQLLGVILSHHALLAAERARGDRLEAALRDRDDLIDYILKNSLGGWAGRTVDEISRWKKARAAMKEGAL